MIFKQFSSKSYDESLTKIVVLVVNKSCMSHWAQWFSPYLAGEITVKQFSAHILYWRLTEIVALALKWNILSHQAHWITPCQAVFNSISWWMSPINFSLGDESKLLELPFRVFLYSISISWWMSPTNRSLGDESKRLESLSSLNHSIFGQLRP